MGNIASIPVPISLLLFALGIMFSIVGFFTKRSIVDKVKEIDEKLCCIKDDIKSTIFDMKTEMLEKYMTKKEFEDNVNAHRNIWLEMNTLKEKVIRLESTKNGKNNINNK